MQSAPKNTKGAQTLTYTHYLTQTHALKHSLYQSMTAKSFHLPLYPQIKPSCPLVEKPRPLSDLYRSQCFRTVDTSSPSDWLTPKAPADGDYAVIVL